MLRFAVFVLLSLSVTHSVLAVRSSPPSPILPGQYRSIVPANAKNKGDPQVYIAPPGHETNDMPHPGLIIDAPPGGLVKAQVITSNLRGAPGSPLQSVDPKGSLYGHISYKKPMEFNRKDIGAKYERIPGQPARDMPRKALEKVKKKVLPVAAAANAFQQGSSKGASTSNQPGHAQRHIKPLPKPKTSSSSWAPVSAPASLAPAPKLPPSGAFTFSLPKPKGMQGIAAPRVNLDPKGKAPATGSKRKSTSPPADSKRRNRSPGRGSKRRSPSPHAGSKRRSPSPGVGAKKPRLSRRDYLEGYYHMV